MCVEPMSKATMREKAMRQEAMREIANRVMAGVDEERIGGVEWM